MDACIFCKIANHEIGGDRAPVYEDDDIIAVNDIRPKAPVHILFIVKKHIESITTAGDSDQELLGKLMLKIRDVANSQNLVNFKIVSNNGKFQEVKHLHFHLAAGEDLSGAAI